MPGVRWRNFTGVFVLSILRRESAAIDSPPIAKNFGGQIRSGKRMSSETISNQSRLVTRFSSLRDLSLNYEGHRADLVTRPPENSTGGMFINTTRNFPEGAVLMVRFKLAHSGFEISSRAEVR